MVKKKVVVKEQEENSVSFFDKNLIIIFLISKIITVSLLLFFFYSNPEYHTKLGNDFYTGKEILPPLANWDGQHYLTIAEKGYIKLETKAFYPLYPMIIKGTNIIFNNYYFSAFFVNIIFTYLFCYFFYRFSRHYFLRKEALGILCFVLCFPTAFYMTAFYSEAMFMTLLFGFLYYYAVEKSNKCLPFIFLIPLCRGQGFFIIGAIAMYLFTEYFRDNKIDWKKQYYVLTAFTGGVLSYFLYFYFVTGDAFVGFEAQKYFVAKNSVSNIFKPVHFIDYLFSSANTSLPRGERFPNYHDHFNVFFGWFYDILIDKIFIIGSIFCLFFVYRAKNNLWLLFYFVLFYPVASMGVGVSFTRFALAFIPLLGLALWKIYPNRKKILYSISFLFLCLQVYFMYRFSLGLWVA